MLYLIASNEFIIDNDKKLTEWGSKILLKIGYTNDDEKTSKSRFAAYKLHNPSCQILYTIPNLTEEDEKKVLYKFRDYKYSDYGNEWFEYSQEILDFFDILSKSSKEDIEFLIKDILIDTDKILGDVLDVDERKFVYTYRDLIKLILSNVLTEEDCIGYSWANNFLIGAYESGYRDYSSLIEFIRKKYGDEVIEDYENRRSILESDPYSKDIVEKYYNSTTIVDKLKVLCNNEMNDIILSNISDSDELKSLYKVVGPEGIKATGYNITDIRKEFSKLTFSDINMYIDIYENSIFTIGSIIEGSIIKLEFKNIYMKNKYPSSPKAVDIFNYFNVKSLFISVPNPKKDGEKKRAQAYEILDYNKDSKAYKEYQKYLMEQESLGTLIDKENN